MAVERFVPGTGPWRISPPTFRPRLFPPPSFPRWFLSTTATNLHNFSYRESRSLWWEYIILIPPLPVWPPHVLRITISYFFLLFLVDNPEMSLSRIGRLTIVAQFRWIVTLFIIITSFGFPLYILPLAILVPLISQTSPSNYCFPCLNMPRATVLSLQSIE